MSSARALTTLTAMLLLFSCVQLADAKGKKKEKSTESMYHDMHKEQKEKMRMHQMEMEHLSKIHSDKVEDWTIHTDVDDSKYWFSRSLKRSQREPPKGWTKDKDGKWKAPPRRKEEL